MWRANAGFVASIGVVCEGDGDDPALRVLLPRVASTQSPQLTQGRVVRASGRGNLTKPGGVEKFFRYVSSGHDAVLFVLDADEDCPVDLTQELAHRIRFLRPPVPVALVAANSAFESWFLADLESIAGRPVKSRILIPQTEASSVDPDNVRNPKAKLVALTAEGTTYKESTDQPALASMIDTTVVAARSRSFRRFVSAVRDLEAAVSAQRATVTPS